MSWRPLAESLARTGLLMATMMKCLQKQTSAVKYMLKNYYLTKGFPSQTSWKSFVGSVIEHSRRQFNQCLYWTIIMMNILHTISNFNQQYAHIGKKGYHHLWSLYSKKAMELYIQKFPNHFQDLAYFWSSTWKSPASLHLTKLTMMSVNTTWYDQNSRILRALDESFRWDSIVCDKKSEIY